MIAAIADTHAVVWYLFADSRLGSAASAFIDATLAAGNKIGVSAIGIAEMVYLVEKARIPRNALIDLDAAISDPKAILQQVPLDEAVAFGMIQVSRQDVPDLPDRIIATTGLHYGVPVLTRDARMRSSGISTIWE